MRFEADIDRYGKLFEIDNQGNLKWHKTYEEEVVPDRPITTILDLGTGEGRIAGMLARLGFNVMGLDISSKQLARGCQRIIEEGEGLRGKSSQTGLSYEAAIRLQNEGLLPIKPDLNDQKTSQRYLTVLGNFFDLEQELNRTLNEWKLKFPDVDPYEFFSETKVNIYVFSDPSHMFSNAAFDLALFNWNTFCETGSPENQKDVLEQILNVLNRGGELILEIPDRKVEPYASALAKYHNEHPDEPYGTIRDPKPADFNGLEGDSQFPPRYFPDIDELILLLKSIGYEMDPSRDVQTYLIEKEEAGTNIKTLTLKEYFITARKSKY